MVTWKFAATNYREIVVADSSIKMLTKQSGGKLDKDTWIEAVKKATQVIISFSMEIDYVKTQYRVYSEGRQGCGIVSRKRLSQRLFAEFQPSLT